MQPLLLVSARNRQFQCRELSGKVPCGDGNWALLLLAEVLGIPCFTHWLSFCVPPMGWGSQSLWFPPAAQPKSHVHETMLSRGLVGWKASGGPLHMGMVQEDRGSIG